MTAATQPKTPTAPTSGAVLVSGQFDFDREPPPEWVKQLEEISPPAEDRGFLRLVWEPGDPWAPVQRWELWEMIHPSVVDPSEVRELRGPHPRKEGHPCTSTPISSWAVRPAPNYEPCKCRHKTDAWRGGVSLVSLTEWKVFQRTGYVGRPFWIIQGTTGGHKCAFAHDEALLLEAEGYPAIAPAAGALPYAPFDGRVLRSITRFNRLWQFKNNIDDYRETMGPGYERYRREVNKELRRELVGHLRTQMEDVAELFVKAADLGELDDQPRTDIDYDRLEPQNEAHYVETGNILHHSRAH